MTHTSLRTARSAAESLEGQDFVTIGHITVNSRSVYSFVPEGVVTLVAAGLIDQSIDAYTESLRA